MTRSLLAPVALVLCSLLSFSHAASQTPWATGTPGGAMPPYTSMPAPSGSPAPTPSDDPFPPIPMPSLSDYFAPLTVHVPMYSLGFDSYFTCTPLAGSGSGYLCGGFSATQKVPERPSSRETSRPHTGGVISRTRTSAAMLELANVARVLPVSGEV